MLVISALMSLSVKQSSTIESVLLIEGHTSENEHPSRLNTLLDVATNKKKPKLTLDEIQLHDLNPNIVLNSEL